MDPSIAAAPGRVFSQSVPLIWISLPAGGRAEQIVRGAQWRRLANWQFGGRRRLCGRCDIGVGQDTEEYLRIKAAGFLSTGGGLINWMTAAAEHSG